MPHIIVDGATHSPAITPSPLGLPPHSRAALSPLSLRWSCAMRQMVCGEWEMLQQTTGHLTFTGHHSVPVETSEGAQPAVNFLQQELHLNDVFTQITEKCLLTMQIASVSSA